jgi:predicted PurR-regulated permease PerM
VEKKDFGSKPPRWIWRWTIGALALWWVSKLVSSFVVELKELLIISLVALLLASGIEPIVNKLERRRWRRGVSTFLIIATAISILLGSFVGAGAIVASQIKSIIDSLPSLMQTLSEFSKRFGIEFNSSEVSSSIESGLMNFWKNSFDDAIMRSSEIIGQGLIGAFILFYLVAEGPRLRRNICSLLPAKKQEVVLEIWTHAIEKAGGYLNMRVALAAAAAASTYLAFTLLQIPYALALAIWVGLVSQLIPVIGTYLAAALPIALTVVSEHPDKTIWVVIFIILYQQIENVVIAPKLGREMMSVHPAVGFVAVIAGATVAGAAGALIAAPVVATAQAALSASVEKYQLIESELLKETERRKKSKRRGRKNLKEDIEKDNDIDEEKS